MCVVNDSKPHQSFDVHIYFFTFVNLIFLPFV